MTDKLKPVRVTTPTGAARYPRLNKPDTKFVPQGEYSVKLILTQADLDTKLKSGKTLTETIDELIAAKLVEQKAELLGEPKTKAKAAKLSSVSPIKEDVDEEGNPNGNFFINFKMKAKVEPKGKPAFEQKPAIFDAKGTKPAKSPAIWGGSKLKVSADLVPYYTPKDNVVGVTCRLRGVQIIELVSGGDGNAESMGFEAEEGYTFSDEAATASGGEGGGEAGGDGDF